MGKPIVVTLMHLGGQRAELERMVDAERLALAFPGIGGFRDESARIVWAVVRQQSTTIDAKAPDVRTVREIFTSTGIKVVTESRMADWLNCHTIFISCLNAAIIRAGGDPVRAARSPTTLNRMVGAIHDGFRTYRKRGGRVRPIPLAVLFGPVPAAFAARYWKRELQGPVGAITLAPHIRDSEHDEVPLLCHEAKALLGGDAPVLERWLAPLVDRAGREE